MSLFPHRWQKTNAFGVRRRQCNQAMTVPHGARVGAALVACRLQLPAVIALLRQRSLVWQCCHGPSLHCELGSRARASNRESLWDGFVSSPTLGWVSQMLCLDFGMAVNCCVCLRCAIAEVDLCHKLWVG